QRTVRFDHTDGSGSRAAAGAHGAITRLPVLVLGGGSYESAHPASCSLDVRVGPLRRRRRTTFLDRLTRGRRVLGLSPPGSIARNAGGQQARVRELSGVGPRATADRVTSRSPATAALAVDRNQSRREIFHHTG